MLTTQPPACTDRAHQQPPADHPAAITLIASVAKQRHWRIMTAESCTGGLLAAALTAQAGASAWFSGAVIAYCNALKQQLLQVPETLLTTHGAVSEPTAQAMCRGLVTLGANAGVAITGIAGPDGGTPTKPVGSVCFGILIPGRIHTFTQQFSGDRTAVRAAAVSAALVQLAASLS